MHEEQWNQLENEIRSCSRCGLCAGRIQAVPGEGNREARVLFVGEGPGAQEDHEGRPFVGAAGKLLNRMLASIGIRREDVYIANVVKCRPPQNRTPTDEECAACMPYLRRQIELIRPWIIVCMGTPAARALIDPNARITLVRGKLIERDDFHILGTYHPAALLRDERLKVAAWDDLVLLRNTLRELEAENE